MSLRQPAKLKRLLGFSLVEVIIVIAILGLVFGGLFASFEYSLRLIAVSRSKMSALSIATDRMEYIRSLPYDQIGTVLGLPPGPIPQTRVVSLNGYEFSERVLVEWVDDPSDGFGPLDYNGITTDYKRVKLAYEWLINNATTTLDLVSNVVPRGIETNVGGGSVRVNVFDANVQPLQSIQVRLVNTTTVPPIDTIRPTGPSGIALFSGAPAAAGYNVFVSAPGFTSDQTREPDAILANPSTLPAAVVETGITTLNFQVDRVSQLALRFLSNRNLVDTAVDLTDVATIATSSAVAVTAEITLAEVGGVYETLGEVWLSPFTPTPNLRWGNFSLVTNRPTGTQVTVQFYTSTSTGDLIPDADLPGNSSGFTLGLVDLRALPVATYPTLVARLELETADLSLTPTVSEISWLHLESETPMSGLDFGLRGQKTIGTQSDLAPVFKFNASSTTLSDGVATFSNLEWDQFRVLGLGSQVIRDACPGHPFAIAPNTSSTVEFLIGPTSANNLRVTVQTGSGLPIYKATVLLERPGFSVSDQTSWCGQTYFGSLLASDEYQLTVGAPGLATSTQTNLDISGTNEMVVVLNP